MRQMSSVCTCIMYITVHVHVQSVFVVANGSVFLTFFGILLKCLPV